MATKKSEEEFNKELIRTLQKLVNPKRLNAIYDKVIAYQTSQKALEHQQYVLGVIKDYIKEIDVFLTER